MKSIEIRLKINLLLLCSLLLVNKLFAQQADVVLFDFEKGNMDNWTLVGENFLNTGKPIHADSIKTWVRGPIGFIGKYYLESSRDHGRHTYNPDGSWQSPEFVIQRNYLNFYLAGELHPNVRVYLQVNGKIVREAFGNNCYDLILRGWNVAEFKGHKACFVVEDRAALRSLIRLDHVFLSNTPSPSADQWVKIEDRERSSLVAPGEFIPIFKNNQIADGNWVTERASIVYGPDKQWHLFAQVLEASNPWEPRTPGNIIHAVSNTLKSGWEYKGIVMEADEQFGEQFLIDPYVMLADSMFYLFYVGAGQLWSGWYTGPEGNTNPWHLGGSGDYGPNSMFLASSKTGEKWERIGIADGVEKPGKVFTEKPFGLSPSVVKINNEWVMYYASATNETVYSKHTIGYRTSTDLINWSMRSQALTDWSKDDAAEAAQFGNHVPASPWPEHSFFMNPFVFNRGETWYLLAGPIDNSNLSRYHCLRIYTSNNPFHFANHHQAKTQNKRIFVDGGGRPFRDVDGTWYIFHSNSMSGGVWIAPLYWNDGNDQKETSIEIPK